MLASITTSGGVGAFTNESFSTKRQRRKTRRDVKCNGNTPHPYRRVVFVFHTSTLAFLEVNTLGNWQTLLATNKVVRSTDKMFRIMNKFVHKGQRA